MGLLNKLKAGGGMTSIGIGGYMLYSPEFSSKVMDHGMKYLPYLDKVPEGSVYGVDYRTIAGGGVAALSILGGIISLYEL